MYLQKTIKSIRDLKIQGAENVAKESLYVVRNILKESKAKTANHLITELEYVKKLLFDSRPTEPCMHSTINCLLKDLDPKSLERTKRHLKQNIDFKEVMENLKDEDLLIDFDIDDVTYFSKYLL